MSYNSLFYQGQLICKYTVCSSCQTCTAWHRKFTTSSALYGFLKRRLTNADDYLEDWQKKQVKFTEKREQKKAEDKKKIKKLEVYQDIRVKQLAAKLNRTPSEILEMTYQLDPLLGNVYRNRGKISSFKLIQRLVGLCGYHAVKVPPPGSRTESSVKEDKDVYPQPPPDPSVLVKRPPVVTIMGHVDHGKTTLLDALRNSNIVDKEFGGITQHIGAFSVTLKSGATITFLDTPGHKAFSAMRGRGASLTDIVVLVIAAEDGVMPTTEESIQHARNANVPIIVAINKIDHPNADVEKTKKMLLNYDLVPETFGGDIQCIPISALKRINLTELQEAIIAQAEIMDLKGDPTGLVEGRIIECKLNKARGKLASMVVQRGTLKVGDFIIAGTGWAKVRSMINEKGESIKKAELSTPIEILGWKELPSPGDQVLQVKSENTLKEALDWRNSLIAEKKLEQDLHIINEKKLQNQDEHEVRNKLIKKAVGEKTIRHINYKYGEVNRGKESTAEHEGPQLNIIVKGDVDGSIEAILNTLVTYKSKYCRLELVHYGIGEVTPKDVDTAQALEGEIFAFNVPVPESVSNQAKSVNVSIHKHNVIYRLFETLVERLSSRIPTVDEEETIGEAEVLQIFHVTVNKKKMPIAGCRCYDGNLKRKELFKVTRDDTEIFSGTLASLKHLKNEVDSIKKGLECGLMLSDTSVEIKPGDIITCFQIKQVTPTLDWEPGF